jgi:hypothetical protein
MAHVEKLERVREERERQYLEEQRSGKTGGTKVRDSAASFTITVTDPTIHLAWGKGSCRSRR